MAAVCSDTLMETIFEISTENTEGIKLKSSIINFLSSVGVWEQLLSTLFFIYAKERTHKCSDLITTQVTLNNLPKRYSL